MCHLILWYHVLCQHLNQAYTTRIRCLKATWSNDDCVHPELVKFPMFGFCEECHVEDEDEYGNDDVHDNDAGLG